MKEKKIELSFTSAKLSELSVEEKQLVANANSAFSTAYAPYSGFLVGASILLENYSVVQTFLMNGLLKENIFNLILSNPPYIPTSKIADLDSEVANYGPRMALDGGENGMSYLSKIIKETPFYLISKGILLLEIDHEQAESCIKEINHSDKYGIPVIHKDLAGLNRVVEVEKK